MGTAQAKKPTKDEDAKPTRLALSAHAWGEPVPKTMGATKKASSQKNSLVKNINKRKAAGTSRSKKKSTVSKKAYKEMSEGWEGKKRAKKKAK